MDPYLRPVRQFFWDFQSTCYPILLPYLNRLAVFAQESPSVVSLAVLLLVLAIMLQILSWVRRMMVWWFRLVTRVMFWGTVVVLASVVWQRGLGRTLQDVMMWGEELSDVWWREYRRWEGYQNMRRDQGAAGGASAKASWR